MGAMSNFMWQLRQRFGNSAVVLPSMSDGLLSFDVSFMAWHDVANSPLLVRVVLHLAIAVLASNITTGERHAPCSCEQSNIVCEYVCVLTTPCKVDTSHIPT